MSAKSALDLPAPLLASGGESWRASLVAALERAPSPSLSLAGFERLIDAGGERVLLEWPESDLADLAAVLGSSSALTRYLTAFGQDWPAAARAYREANPERAAMEAFAAIPRDAEFEQVAARVRALARREMYRIGARDLLGLATLDDTLSAITRLAEVAIALAVDRLRRRLAAEQGDVVDPAGRPVGFCVLGLGKLGGGELNYSSDVDLLYLYERDEVGASSPEARPFFGRLAGDVTRAIGEPTADGIVFRVDLRLRPEGHAGPLINSIDNALMYYEGWGDTWERGALAKARPVGGNLVVGERFVEEIRPFVYRRHLDYQTIEDLRRMKDRIDAEQAVQAPGVRDAKLGWGCIRELEFVVQTLQLIHGGHETEAQAVGTRAALAALEKHGMIAADEAAGLTEAYAFLRDVEHAVQVVEQRQTQRLPITPADLRALGRRLGYGTGRRGRPANVDELAAFESDWTHQTTCVRTSFVRFLELRADERDEGDGAAEDPKAMSLLGRIERGETAAAAAVLESMGFPDGDKAVTALQRLYRGPIAAPASPQRRRAVESMAPTLLRAVGESADPEAALDRLVEFLFRTGAHTSYLALLGGSRATMTLLVTLFATSPYLASHLVGHPELIDLLVRSDQAGAIRNERALDAELGDFLPDGADEEDVLAGLRRFRNAAIVRIGMQDLAGVLSAEEVHEQLTLLADVCLRRAADEARRLVAERLPIPADGVDLAIVALGKMGGREMTYASDLDLLFVYDSSHEGFDPDAHGFATRWVQKTMALLQSRTRDGTVFAIDARLRPSGRSGPLVTSLERFIDYHENEAELWERQAHIRARVAYGPDALARRIAAVMERFVYGAGLDDEGVAAIDQLRRRLEKELADEGPRRRNIKTGRGGIVDIEFLVQMLQLRHGAEHEEVRVRGTVEALNALKDAALLPARDAGALAEHYRFLRRLEARMRLERDRPVEELGTDKQLLTPLARRLGFQGDDPADELLASYERTRDEVRATYERYFGSVDV